MNKFLLAVTAAFILQILNGCANDSSLVASGDSSTSVPVQMSAAETSPGWVTGGRIVNADAEPNNWLSHGRTYEEQRFSPLKQINAANVSQLKLDWYFEFTTQRGLEATPIVVDGKMYVSGAWSMVYAFDAKTGELLWQYDPKVPPEWAVNLCCDVVNRGVALWKGKVYLGTLDGRLLALEANTGELVWSVQTTDTERPYSITGAPRIVNDKVIIGNGGGEFGVRGYVSAYDSETGEQLWRFYTVPGDPSKPFESEAMKKAADTWRGGEWWKVGGGGTVWDSMAYDPKLNLLYIGVGNGSPWNREIRSPGGGDNLYLSSMVALNPDSGEYVWHYQTTPGETWDYTAAQHMILADLEIAGKTRKVIMQAPKNGFFYVLDRKTGEFISAENYVTVNWADGVDPDTGRPRINPEARYIEKGFLTQPSPLGGHNWHPMSFSPETGLVYIPAQEIPYFYSGQSGFEYQPGHWNIGVDALAGSMPEDPAIKKSVMAMIKGHIAAWDPVQQKEVWRVQHPFPWNGGLLSTAGNLLFQGNAEGGFVAYSADEGKQLWSADAQTGVIAAPISYSVDGEQYVAVMAGWGGNFPLTMGEVAEQVGQQNQSRLLVYSLKGTAEEPTDRRVKPVLPEPPELTADAQTIEEGKRLFHQFCFVCHGDAAVGGGVLPDLRYLTPEKHKIWQGIVVGGAYRNKGMVSFAKVMTLAESESIQAYVIKRAQDAYRSKH